ncbi:hypothetical protein Bbelb_424040 [Branchiostoma belcheri]|nr:hypothetical protein Bbelb_424040 [Branchiostoma belcheri]
METGDNPRADDVGGVRPSTSRGRQRGPSRPFVTSPVMKNTYGGGDVTESQPRGFSYLNNFPACLRNPKHDEVPTDPDIFVGGAGQVLRPPLWRGRSRRLEACLGVVTRETKHAKDSSTLPQARTTQANVSMPESVVCDNDIGAEECRPVHTRVFKTRRSVETCEKCDFRSISSQLPKQAFRQQSRG